MKKSKNYKNIIFDLDGTLIDSRDGILNSILFTLRELSIKKNPKRQDFYWCIGPRLTVCFAKILNTKDKALIRKAIGIYRKRYIAHGVFECKLYSNIRDLLYFLEKKGKNIYIATNKSQSFAKEIAAHFKINHFFKKIYGFDLNIGKIKKTELLKNLLLKEKIKSSETLMVGDRKYDIIAAKVNNIDTAGILYGYGSLSELKGVDPTFIAKDTKSIESILS